MADKRKKSKQADAGTLGRLSKAGEDALTKLADELGKNERVTDALARAMSAKGKLDDGARRAVGTVGLAAADELKDLRSHIEKLEKRLAKLEAESKPAAKPKPAPKPKAAKPPAASPPAAAKPEAPQPPPPGPAGTS